MNSRPHPSAPKHSPSSQPASKRTLESWRNQLAECAAKPGRGRVHALRGLTLRLRTVFELRLREQPPDHSAVRAFRHWKKKGKKLRRALEPSRDADVYLARLATLRESLAGSTGGPPPDPRCLREIAKLESRLKQQRRKGIERLTTFLDARGKRLNRLSRKMEAALAPHSFTSPGSTRQAALSIVGSLAAELPSLSSANLHAWRKRLKQALFLAELSAPSDPSAKRLAVALRKMHVAAGEWHDWQSLAVEARRLLPSRKPDGIVPVLDTLADAALERALTLCRNIAPSLLGNASQAPPSPPRKPVAGEQLDPALNPAGKSA